MINEQIAYPLSFRAAVLDKNHQPLQIKEVTFQGPLESGQVLVRILYSGVCGKQIEEIDATKGPDPFLPHMLGHEGTGLVMDVGPGVRKVHPGDTVVLHWLKGSGIEAPTPKYYMDGERLNAGWITTFNEYGVISENRMTPIQPDADLSLACLLGCAVTTGVGVVLNELNLRPGQSIAVFGCGGVGLNVVQGARMVNATPIIAVDPNPASLALAAKLGATHLVNPNEEDPIEAIKTYTNGKGTLAVVVAVGKASVVETAAEASSIPGKVILVGVPPTGAKISIDSFAIHCRRTFTGSYGGGTYPDRDIPHYLELVKQGRLQLEPLIFGKYSLDQINSGIQALRSGQPGRCVIEIWNER